MQVTPGNMHASPQVRHLRHVALHACVSQGDFMQGQGSSRRWCIMRPSCCPGCQSRRPTLQSPSRSQHGKAGITVRPCLMHMHRPICSRPSSPWPSVMPCTDPAILEGSNMLYPRLCLSRQSMTESGSGTPHPALPCICSQVTAHHCIRHGCCCCMMTSRPLF